MGSLRTDFDLLLESPESVEADLAIELLASAGIPTFLHSSNVGIAGRLGAEFLSYRADLYVPKGARARAEQVLREAWGDEALERGVTPRPSE